MLAQVLVSGKRKKERKGTGMRCCQIKALGLQAASWNPCKIPALRLKPTSGYLAQSL